MDKVKLSLESLDGNAFALLGAFAAQARRQGWPQQSIEKVRVEAMAGDYDHLLQTLIAHTDRPERDADRTYREDVRQDISNGNECELMGMTYYPISTSLAANPHPAAEGVAKGEKGRG